MAKNIVGIDLGTSSCSVALVIDGRPQLLPIFDGDYEMPTYVAFGTDGQRIIGAAAKRQSVTNPENTIFTIKRLMGRKYASPATQSELGLLPYKVSQSSTGNLWVRAGERSYTPTEITAMMLTEVRRQTENYLRNPLDGAVITIPAYFDESQRRATRDAATIAGIKTLRLIAEPTAAALAHGFGHPADNGTIAVYDLGGGTFDISILTIGDGVFEVKSVNGDNRLGGEDFDHILVRYFVENLKKTERLNLINNPMALHRIKDAVEQIKIRLDSAQIAEAELPYLAQRAGTFVHASLSLTRSKLDNLVSELINRTLIPCQQALSDAGISAKELDGLVLVGGMSRMPILQRRVSSFFGHSPSHQIDPSQVVAHGAAIYAAVLNGTLKDVLLLDVIPMSLGIGIDKNQFCRIVDKNTTIPTKKSKIFSTGTPEEIKELEKKNIHVDIVNSNIISIFQGDNEQADKNLHLGKISIPKNVKNPEAPSLFEITFDIEPGDNFQISVRNLFTGETQSEIINVPDPFSKNSLDRSDMFAEEHIAALREQADALLNVVDKSLKIYANQVHPKIIEKIEYARDGLRIALQTRDIAELEEALATLATASNYNPPPVRSEPLPDPVVINASRTAPSVFISYAREDRAWLDRIRTYLRPLERQGRLEIWHDGRIAEGMEWQKEIEAALSHASCAILLISGDFLASDFIYENEFKRILQRNEASGLSIFPIFIRHCAPEMLPGLAKLNGFNDPERPFSSMTDVDIEKSLVMLARSIQNRLTM